MTDDKAFTFHAESPLGADLGLLFARHSADMTRDTPAESMHMMDAQKLAAPEIRFFVLRHIGVPVAMGAFKRITPDHGEVKSMHVLSEWRGKGLSRKMLEHLVEEARAEGIRRLSLETGAQPSFAPAMALYLGQGFVPCPPFEGYTEDPNSVFLTRDLSRHG